MKTLTTIGLMIIFFSDAFSAGMVDVRIIHNPTYPLGVIPTLTIRIENKSDQTIHRLWGFMFDQVRFRTIVNNDTIPIMSGLEVSYMGEKVLKPYEVFEHDLSIRIFTHTLDQNKLPKKLRRPCVNKSGLNLPIGAFFPEGTYYVSARISYNVEGIEERFHERAEAQFEVIMPEGEDKVVYDIFAEAFYRSSDILFNKEQLELIIQNYPDSPYTKPSILRLLGCMRYFDYNIRKTIHDYARSYLESGDADGSDLAYFYSGLRTFYRLNSDKDGWLEECREIERNLRGTRLEGGAAGWADDASKMSEKDFDRRSSLKVGEFEKSKK